MPPETNNVPPVAPQPAPAPAPAGSNNTLMSVLCYLGILIIIPFVTGASNDPAVKFHIKQGLALIISFVVGMFIGVIPVIGWIISPLLFLFNIVMLILGIINAASGKQKELPLLGQLANKLNF